MSLLQICQQLRIRVIPRTTIYRLPQRDAAILIHDIREGVSPSAQSGEEIVTDSGPGAIARVIRLTAARRRGCWSTMTIILELLQPL